MGTCAHVGRYDSVDEKWTTTSRLLDYCYLYLVMLALCKLVCALRMGALSG